LSRTATASAPVTILTGAIKEGVQTNFLGASGGFLEVFDRTRRMCLDQGMAISPSYEPEVITIRKNGRVREYTAPYGVELHERSPNNLELHVVEARYVDSYIEHTEKSEPTAKETKVAKSFDTSETKNTALNAIQSSIDKLERALFDRAVALGRVEAEHRKIITDTSLSFDRVLMEAIQSGLTAEDLDKHLPNYAENLSLRMEELRDLVALANAEELV